jgi:hypothetical protein
MEELVKLELIKMVHPPYDMGPPCHTSNFLANFSSNFTQSTTCNLPAEVGTPRYFRGDMPMLQLNISAYSRAISLPPPLKAISHSC